MAELRWVPFAIEETLAADGTLSLRLQGELDIVVADQLEERLRELRRTSGSVTLDLSRLQFLDSTGLRVILRAVLEARKNGWELAVRRELSPQVQRVFELVQAEHLLWP